MTNRTIAQLPSIEPDTNTMIPASSREAGTGSITFSQIVAALRREFGFVDQPLRKCVHCGQWGAVYCACAHCGAPIDP